MNFCSKVSNTDRTFYDLGLEYHSLQQLETFQRANEYRVDHQRIKTGAIDTFVRKQSIGDQIRHVPRLRDDGDGDGDAQTTLLEVRTTFSRATSTWAAQFAAANDHSLDRIDIDISTRQTPALDFLDHRSLQPTVCCLRQENPPESARILFRHLRGPYIRVSGCRPLDLQQWRAGSSVSHQEGSHIWPRMTSCCWKKRNTSMRYHDTSSGLVGAKR